jgi:hypothetical protein
MRFPSSLFTPLLLAFTSQQVRPECGALLLWSPLLRRRSMYRLHVIGAGMSRGPGTCVPRLVFSEASCRSYVYLMAMSCGEQQGYVPGSSPPPRQLDVPSYGAASQRPPR